MKISKYKMGWQIESSTSNEEAHLKYLLNALRKAYGVSVEAGSHAPEPVDHDKSKPKIA